MCSTQSNRNGTVRVNASIREGDIFTIGPKANRFRVLRYNDGRGEVVFTPANRASRPMTYPLWKLRLEGAYFVTEATA